MDHIGLNQFVTIMIIFKILNHLDDQNIQTQDKIICSRTLGLEIKPCYISILYVAKVINHYMYVS